MKKLVVGLGNYGTQYQNTFHNCGFEVVDELAKRFGVKIKKLECKSAVAACSIESCKVVLAKPLTYMNASGDAVAELLQKHCLSNDSLIVVFDDCDIPLGTLRIRKEGSGGTHNGCKDVVRRIGQDFLRIRVGIGRPADDRDIADYVLDKIDLPSKKLLVVAYERAADAVEELLAGKPADEVMQKFNKN